MATGKITQIIGAVIDVEFPRESIPKVYEALKLKEVDLTLEVQQQLGDGIVRTIAMGASEGLKRGLEVESTNAPISVPVGKATLGRIMDVLGTPLDNRGPVASQDKWSGSSRHGYQGHRLARAVREGRQDWSFRWCRCR